MRRSFTFASGLAAYVEIIFFSIPTPAATARSYSSGTVAESWSAIPEESKRVFAQLLAAGFLLSLARGGWWMSGFLTSRTSSSHPTA
jgi:hypothetical protein